jgi:hypothetical protein
VPEGITEGDANHTTTKTTIWLSGGEIGSSYTITNRITTAGGRTMDQSVRLVVKAK